MLGALLVAVVGISGSIVGSQVVARDTGQKSHAASVTSSVEIAAALKLAIQREQDLAVNTGAYIINDPGATETEFLQWVSSDRQFTRFPELIGIGYVVMVPTSQLPQFAHSSEAASGSVAGSFQVNPAGVRPYYCFATLTSSASGLRTSPPDLDLCDTALGANFLNARDSGQSTYLPYGAAKSADLAVGTAIYQRGVLPSTVADRRSAFLGWVGIQVAPHVLLSTALAGHPHVAVAFHYGSGSSAVTFTAGTAPVGAHALSVDLHNGWQVRVTEAAPGGGVIGDTSALAVLLGGILISLLLGLVLYVLATGRTRALALVAERTNELRHQALHDPLTGLPNRSLILDRLEQMLSRGRRQDIPVAALFIDLDDFKEINDTLGHAVGDELLVTVGTRLTSALRSEDTVGRLGGDEFVVLVEGASLVDGAQVVADRLLDVLSAGFDLPGIEVPLSVTASIGIAEGNRPSAGRLLQDADIALVRGQGGREGTSGCFRPGHERGGRRTSAPGGGPPCRPRHPSVLASVPAHRRPCHRNIYRSGGPVALATPGTGHRHAR